jgi:aminopeptidase
MESLVGPFTSLFTVNMGAKTGERILVFTDLVRPDESPLPADADRRARLQQVAGEAAEFARSQYGNTLFLAYPATPASGAEPPEPLWRAAFGDKAVDDLVAAGLLARLLAKEATAEDLCRAEKLVMAQKDAACRVIIALANNSTSHTRFRALANAVGCRFASLPNFDPEMFFTSMQVDWQRLALRTRRLADQVNRATALSLTTPNGTRMRFGKVGRQAAGDDGILDRPGSFGNLPAGEVYLAPLEGTSEGTMVLEYAPTRKLDSPLRLTVEKGLVVAVDGAESYRQKLEQKFAESPNNRNIAELGIGTNDRASRPDNILEAEKILGTIHIALGDNSGFGGTVQTPFHEDYVFYRPTLTAHLEDGTDAILLENGTPLF